MVITIQFQTEEDLKWLKPLIQLLKRASLKVEFKGKVATEETAPVDSNQVAATNVKNQGTPITDRLHGSLKLPPDFDYKEFLADELLAKYLSNE